MTEDVANALIGFDTNSLATSVDDGKLSPYLDIPTFSLTFLYYFCLHITTESSIAVLTVVRSGALGTVVVYWMTGLQNSSVANGSIVPDQGSFQMNPSDTSAEIMLMVCTNNTMWGRPRTKATNIIYNESKSTNSLPYRPHHETLMECRRCLQCGCRWNQLSLLLCWLRWILPHRLPFWNPMELCS